ncbi:pyridoxal-phosphate dependent enzyme [Bacillus velezensis]|nr:pyridoxal-phosphate dependent enzyme [Bacillus velezensis]
MMNPGGSIKDRLGGMLIEDALRTGKVKPGGVIIEATAGNTGIGLALCARKHQLRAIFASRSISAEKSKNYESSRADIVHTPREEGMQEPSEKRLNWRERLIILMPFCNLKTE